MTKERQYDLEDPLIDYAVRIARLSEPLPTTKQEGMYHIKYYDF